MPSRIIAQRMDAKSDKSANSSTNRNFAHSGSGADSVVPPPDSSASQVSLEGGNAAPTPFFIHDNASDERMNTSIHQQSTLFSSEWLGVRVEFLVLVFGLVLLSKSCPVCVGVRVCGMRSVCLLSCRAGSLSSHQGLHGTTARTSILRKPVAKTLIEVLVHAG